MTLTITAEDLRGLRLRTEVRLGAQALAGSVGKQDTKDAARLFEQSVEWEPTEGGVVGLAVIASRAKHWNRVASIKKEYGRSRSTRRYQGLSPAWLWRRKHQAQTEGKAEPPDLVARQGGQTVAPHCRQNRKGLGTGITVSRSSTRRQDRSLLCFVPLKAALSEHSTRCSSSVAIGTTNGPWSVADVCRKHHARFPLSSSRRASSIESRHVSMTATAALDAFKASEIATSRALRSPAAPAASAFATHCGQPASAPLRFFRPLSPSSIHALPE